jgi:hypothetical protein
MATNHEQTYKPARLVLSFSALKRNENYFRSTCNQKKCSHFFPLSEEKALVVDLKKRPNL